MFGVPKTSLFGTLSSLLRSVCACSYLYPEPLHIVVRGSAAGSLRGRFTLRATGFYAPSWIRASEKTPAC
jgi:hypothetical protein